MNVRFKKRNRPPWLEALESRELLSTLTVFSAVDGVAGSLRSVIGQAQAGDVIQFAPKLQGATLYLTAGEIDITQAITVAGSRQTIDASHQSRIFNIDSASVSIAGLTLADGLATLDESRGYVGGAIEAVGTQLTLTGITFRNNVAQGGGDSPDGTSVWSAGGGAIYAEGGTLTLNKCSAYSNSVLGGDNTINQQAGQGVGGVILVNENPLTINGGQFNGNLASYVCAMDFEAASARLYGQLAQTAEEHWEKELFRRIAAEDEMHFTLIEQIRELFESSPGADGVLDAD